MKRAIVLLTLILAIYACEGPKPEPRVTIDPKTKKLSIPPNKQVDYLGEINADSLFVIFYDKDSFDYENFRCFIGPGDTMIEQEVLWVDRMRDGGSTRVIIADTNGMYSDMLRRHLSEFWFPFADTATFRGRVIKMW
jgi:hypothetical protein